MAAFLKNLARGATLNCALLCTLASAQELGGHEWTLELGAGYVGASSALGAWTKGEPGKLRYDESDQGLIAARAVAEYRGQLAPTLWGNAAIDFANDASSGLDVAEAYLEWRPVPRSGNRYRWRLGAFYPPLSLENSGAGWSSPYSISYSAINTWLAEEIRPFGAEWSMRRRIGSQGSPHELSAFAATFYGNDPAGTLLFWRGWSLHDRQSRLTDTLNIPRTPVWDGSGNITGLRDQYLEPFDDIDHAPGYYAGVEWRYARKALVQLSHYDNRADPNAFSDGQWGWKTTFDQLAFQVNLPGRVGLIGQWMRGETYWLVGVGPDGVISPFSYLAEDRFESGYLLLTRNVKDAHRWSIRYDDFEIAREEQPPVLRADGGTAWTLAYSYEPTSRLTIAVEWMQIESSRDLWSIFYGIPERATERQLRTQVTLRLGAHRPSLNVTENP